MAIATTVMEPTAVTARRLGREETVQREHAPPEEAGSIIRQQTILYIRNTQSVQTEGRAVDRQESALARHHSLDMLVNTVSAMHEEYHEVIVLLQ
jgi:hypothetical protein